MNQSLPDLFLERMKMVLPKDRYDLAMEEFFIAKFKKNH